MPRRTAFLIFLGFLCAVLVWLFLPFMSAFVLAITAVIGLSPLYTALRRVCFGNAWIASFLSTAVLVGIIAVPASLIMNAAAEQGLDLIRDLIHQKDAWLPRIEEWTTRLKITWSWQAVLPDILQRGAQLISQFSPNLLLRTTQFLVHFILFLIIAFFLFVEGPALRRELQGLSPLDPHYSEAFFREIHVTLKACLYGYILTALVQGILAGIGFYVAGLKVAVILGVLTMLMAFVPIIGATGVWLPVALYFFAVGDWKTGAALSAYGGLVISGIDNILKPLLIRGKVDIHPVMIFLTILGGLKAFGPIGFLLGPLIMAVFLAAVRIYKRDFLESSIKA